MADLSDPENAYEIVRRDAVPARPPPPNVTPEQRMAELLLWLQPTDYLSPGNEYMKHMASYAPGTGAWAQASPVFRAWADPKPATGLEHGDGHGNRTSCLHARGVAGSGKSVFAANTIRQLQKSGAVVLFFFSRQIVEKNHSAKYLVRDYAAQLVSHSPSLVISLSAFSQGEPVDGAEMVVVWPAIVKALGELATSGSKVYCVADALDEMDDADFDAMTQRLVALGSVDPDNIRVLMTSRPIPKIEQALRSSSVAHLKLDPALLFPDVARYVDSRMATLEPPLSADKNELVKSAICERASGLFLHARLVADNLAEGLRDGRITETTLPDSLDRLPRSLRDVYEDMLKDHAHRSGVTTDQQARILMCVTHASRPLRLIELASMLSRMLGLDLRRGKDLVRAGCGRLLEILEDETVSVIHHSFTEFLHDVTRKSGQDAFPVLDLATSHAMLAVLTLEYLNSCPFPEPTSEDLKHARERDLSRRKNRDRARQDARRLEIRMAHPLANYACDNLGFHLERAVADGATLPQLLAALDSCLVPGKFALQHWELFSVSETPFVGSRNIFHLAGRSYPGRSLPHFVLAHFAETMPDLIDARDAADCSPLQYASEENRHELVSLLLAKGADPISVAGDGKTPLHRAAAGSPEVVRLLLDAGVDPLIKTAPVLEEYDHYRSCFVTFTEEDAEERRATALDTAFRVAKPGVVEAFLPFVTPEMINWCFHHVKDAKSTESLVTMGKPDIDSFWHGKTKLYRAAQARDLETVKLLLKHGADPNRRNSISKNDESSGFDDPEIETYASAISMTIAVSHQEHGPTPLHGLAGYSYGSDFVSDNEKETTIQCVRVLVNAGADVNATMIGEFSQILEHGWTPLHIAVQQWECSFLLDEDHESEEIVMEALLLAGADPNAKTRIGSSPIHVVNPAKLHLVLKLIQYGANVYSRDGRGRTPLLWMIRSISSGTDTSKETRQQDMETLTKLLELGPDMSVVDNDGGTVMHHIIYNIHNLSSPEHIAFIMRVIDAGADLNSPNSKGEPPIHYLNQRGSRCTGEEALRFLGHAGMDLNGRDNQGRTALFVFTESRDSHLDVLEDLVRIGFDPTVVDSAGNTLLHHAIRYGKPLGWVRFLLSAGVRPGTLGSNGDTLIHAMLRRSSEAHFREMLPVLLNLGVSPLAKNAKGQSALHLAGEGSQICTFGAEQHFLKAVLSHPSFQSLDINEPDLDGFTPLHMTLQMDIWQNETFIGSLLRAGFDPTCVAANGLSPLHLAARAGNANIVCLLLAEYRKRNVLEKHVNMLGDSRAPLHYACKKASLGCVWELLRSGADPSLRDGRGLMPLHALAEEDLMNPTTNTEFGRRTADIAKMLQLAGANLNAEAVIEDEEGGNHGTIAVSALDLAVKLERWEMVRALLSLGVEPRDSHKQSKDFIMSTDKERAAAAARAADARLSLTQDRSSYWWRRRCVWRGRWESHVEAASAGEMHLVPHGQTIFDIGTADEDAREAVYDALNGALKVGDYDSIDEYVQLGGRLDAPYRSHGDTFLHRLVSMGHADVLERYGDQVIAHRALSEAEDQDGSYQPLLNWACSPDVHSLQIIQLFVEKFGFGVNSVHKIDKYHWSTALHILARGDRFWQVEALEYMISKGADVHARDGNGETPLHSAASATYPKDSWNEETARILLNHGADPNAVSGSEGQGLSVLEMWGKPEVTKLLIDHGARLDRTPGLVAQAVQNTMNPATVKLMLEAGLDPNELPPPKHVPDDVTPFTAPGNDSLYALHWAARPEERQKPDPAYHAVQRAIIELLLPSGADPWVSYPDGSFVMQCIIEDRGLVGPILTCAEQDVDRKGHHGRTLLLSACVPVIPVGPLKGDRTYDQEPSVVEVDAVHTLLDLEADVLVTDEEENRTALHWFCTFIGNFDEAHQQAFVALAGRSTAALGRRDKTGRTPIELALAAYTNGSQVSAFAVRHLVSLGSDVDEIDSANGDSALHMIARRLVGDKTAATEAAALLREVAVGRDIDIRNALGETPVFSFAAAGWVPKPDPKRRWAVRETALENDMLHAAALDVFVELGADLAAVDDRGRTLLHVTSSREVPRCNSSFHNWDQHEDIEGMFERLMELGVDPRREDNELRTAIDVAVAKNLNGVLALFTEEGKRKAEEKRVKRSGEQAE